jgi:hypothetical protein
MHLMIELMIDYDKKIVIELVNGDKTLEILNQSLNLSDLIKALLSRFNL